VNARLEAVAIRLGSVNFLMPKEAAAAAKVHDGRLARPWEPLKRKAMGGG
jgi:hypothetical protein